MNSLHSTASVAPASSRGRSRWPIIIVCLLAGHVLLMLAGVKLATGANFTVVPHYYQRAVVWDQTQAIKRASEKLGWHVTVTADRQISPLGQRRVTFELTDAQGKALEGVVLSGQYYHHAHGHQVQSFDLKPPSAPPSAPLSVPGQFVATLPMRYTGLWHFKITARTAAHTWQTEFDQFVFTQGQSTWKP